MKEAQGTQIQRIRLFPDLTGPEYPGLAMPGLEHSGLDSPGWDVWENGRETVVCRSGLGILPDMALGCFLPDILRISKMLACIASVSQKYQKTDIFPQKL